MQEIQFIPNRKLAWFLFRDMETAQFRRSHSNIVSMESHVLEGLVFERLLCGGYG